MLVSALVAPLLVTLQLLRQFAREERLQNVFLAAVLQGDQVLSADVVEIDLRALIDRRGRHSLKLFMLLLFLLSQSRQDDVDLPRGLEAIFERFGRFRMTQVAIAVLLVNLLFLEDLAERDQVLTRFLPRLHVRWHLLLKFLLLVFDELCLQV